MNTKNLKTIREIIVRNMVIVNYDKKWPDDFLKIKDQLQKVLTVHCKVQHVGNTSIPGMKAKPIIDIDVELENWGNFETSISGG